jgi:hypothetical protein
MYLIKDKELIKSLTEKAKDKKHINYNSSMLINHDVKNIFLKKI